jgi:hypothetical protein
MKSKKKPRPITAHEYLNNFVKTITNPMEGGDYYDIMFSIF